MINSEYQQPVGNMERLQEFADWKDERKGKNR